MQQTTVESFRQEMGPTCANIDAVRAVILQMLAAGKKADGSAISKQESVDMRNSIDTMATACKRTTFANIRRMFEQEVDQSTRTCVVLNIHYEDNLHWNERMKLWESRSPETGPRGSITEGRLSRDPEASRFWLLEEHHLFTKRNGLLPDGRSCAVFSADKTYHFTWKAASKPVEARAPVLTPVVPPALANQPAPPPKPTPTSKEIP
jgi:hypothetical protein